MIKIQCMMQQTKLLVIVITGAIIAAASLSAATPAFAKVNCNEDQSICSGGQSNFQLGVNIPGGGGSRTINIPGFSSFSGGAGEGGTLVGGLGVHFTCDDTTCTPPVGGSGLHPK
jgi:hypothetical protein